MQNARSTCRGFTLPTVVVASVAMLAMLLMSFQLSAASSNALRSGYYRQLAIDAARAGGKMAEECLAAGLLWSDPLRPSGVCDGVVEQCTDANCYLMDTGTVRSMFVIEPPVIDGDYIHLVLIGVVHLYSEGSIKHTYEWNHKAQYSGGAVAGDGDDSDYQSGVLKMMAMGEDHTCVISVSKDLYCWGENNQGQLGVGHTDDLSSPTPVLTSGALSGLSILSVTGGENHTCALASDNNAYCWGKNDDGQLGTGDDYDRSSPTAVLRTGALAGLSILQIEAGEDHTCVLASNNRVYCWGEGSNGELGNGSSSDRLVPVAVQNTGVLSGLTILQLEVGAEHACVLASDDNAYCWGDGSEGQLGNNSTSNRSAPVAVYRTGALSGLSLRRISAGGFNTCAVASNDQAYCWGNNDTKQIGDGTSTRRSVPVAVNVSGVLAGKQIMNVQPAAEFGVGGAHTCAIATDYSMYCWGSNDDGQLGDGTKTDRSTPVAVAPPLADMQPVYMALAESASCAAAVGQVLYCWGDNSAGQLGLSGSSDRLAPELVSGFSPLVGGSSPTAGDFSLIYY